MNLCHTAQSWFETEKQAEIEGVGGEDLPQEVIQPSVPTGKDEDSLCYVCHDAFEQFYNEEKEEWHWRPTISFEEKNYHPFCLEDHKVKFCNNLFEKFLAFLQIIKINLYSIFCTLLNKKAMCLMVRFLFQINYCTIYLTPNQVPTDLN